MAEGCQPDAVGRPRLDELLAPVLQGVPDDLQPPGASDGVERHDRLPEASVEVLGFRRALSAATCCWAKSIPYNDTQTS
jgi:hypothetical protein